MTVSLPAVGRDLHLAAAPETSWGVKPASGFEGLEVQFEHFADLSSHQRARPLADRLLAAPALRQTSGIGARLILPVSAESPVMMIFAALLGGSWQTGWPTLDQAVPASLIANNRRSVARHLVPAGEETSLSFLRQCGPPASRDHFGGLLIHEGRLVCSREQGVTLEMRLLGRARAAATDRLPVAAASQPFAVTGQDFSLKLKLGGSTVAIAHLLRFELLASWQDSRAVHVIGRTAPGRIVRGNLNLTGRVDFLLSDEALADWIDTQKQGAVQLCLKDAAGRHLVLDLASVRVLSGARRTSGVADPVQASFSFDVLEPATGKPVTLIQATDS